MSLQLKKSLFILSYCVGVYLSTGEVRSETTNQNISESIDTTVTIKTGLKIKNDLLKENLISDNDFILVKGGCYNMGALSKSVAKTVEGYREEHKKLKIQNLTIDFNETGSPAFSQKSIGIGEDCVEDFYLGKFEVTRRLWYQVMSKLTGNKILMEYRDDLINPKEEEGYSMESPVSDLSMKDIQIFLFILNKIEPNKYRLPTEMEWEYAARSRGLPYKYATSTGNSIWYLANIALDGEHKRNSLGLYTFKGPIPVGSYPPNQLGFYDMTGNVNEWTTLEVEDGNTSKTSKLEGVLKGGSWQSDPEDNEATNIERNIEDIGDVNDDTGFRLIKIVQSQTTSSPKKYTDQKLPNKALKQKTTAIKTSPKENQKENIFPDTDFVFVKGGCYDIGKISDTSSDLNGLQGKHECVDDFYIGKYEVTIGQWIKLISEDVLLNPDEKYSEIITKVPVSGISWEDVQEFISLLNENGTEKYRLPTEAEWEYAARSRGGDYPYSTAHAHLPSSSNLPSSINTELYWNDVTNLPFETSYNYVGTYPPSSLGIYDMTGNVWEWVQDPYFGRNDEHPFRQLLGFPETFPNRVIRGGGFETDPYDWGEPIPLTTIKRGKSPYLKSSRIGFRLVKIKPSDEPYSIPLAGEETPSLSLWGLFVDYLGGLELKQESGSAEVHSFVTDSYGTKEEIANGNTEYLTQSFAFKAPQELGGNRFHWTIYPQTIQSSLIIKDFMWDLELSNKQGTTSIPVVVTDFETGEVVDPQSPNTYRIDLSSTGFIGEAGYHLRIDPIHFSNIWDRIDLSLALGTSIIEQRTVNLDLGTKSRKETKWEGLKYYVARLDAGFSIGRSYLGVEFNLLHYPRLDLPKDVEFRGPASYNKEKEVSERKRIFIDHVEFTSSSAGLVFNYRFN